MISNPDGDALCIASDRMCLLRALYFCFLLFPFYNLLLASTNSSAPPVASHFLFLASLLIESTISFSFLIFLIFTFIYDWKIKAFSDCSAAKNMCSVCGHLIV